MSIENVTGRGALFHQYVVVLVNSCSIKCSGGACPRQVHSLSPIVLCLLLVLPVITLTAGGASPLATQNALVGPYNLLLSFYSLPRAGQELSMTIEPSTHDVSLQFSQAELNPAKDTDGNPVKVAIVPGSESPGVYDVHVTPPVRGIWLLHLQVAGSSGTVFGDIPINVDGPPAIPTWLGWLIGLLPLPLLITFIWFQVRWRKAQRQHLRQAMLERASLNQGS